MTWQQAFLGGMIAAQAGLLGANTVLVWLAWRRWRHAVLLDQLLQRLCTSAFSGAHMPIWTAWTAVMGTIEVKVESKRGWPEDR